MKSRTRSTRRWRNRRPEHRPWCKPWNACANWCNPSLQVPPNWLLPPIRCQRCREVCWIRWTVLHCGQTAGGTRARRDSHPGPRRRDLVEEIRSMSRETHIVGFRVGRETYGVPITSLHEIVRVPEITAVPDAPEYMEGVINLRGKIVSVVDLRKRFGEPKRALNRRNRILVVEHGGRLSGLIVDSASEVIKIPAAEIEPSPATLQEGGLNCVTGLGKYRGRLIVLLDMAKLLDSSARKEAIDPANGDAHSAAAAK